MRGTKVQTLGAVVCACMPTSNSCVCTRSWQASFGNACTCVLPQKKWPPVSTAVHGGSAGSPEQSSFKKNPQIFWTSLVIEYILLISGRTDAPEVRCGSRDWQTDRQTHRPNYRNPRCACMPRVNYWQLTSDLYQFTFCANIYSHKTPTVRTICCWSGRLKISMIGQKYQRSVTQYYSHWH